MILLTSIELEEKSLFPATLKNLTLLSIPDYDSYNLIEEQVGEKD